MALQVPAQALADAMAADGELWPVLLALAWYESGFNPQAIGDGGCSKGYLQLNQCGGLGAGHSDRELLDGQANMRLGAWHIRSSLAAGRGLWEALGPWSVRPQAWDLLQRIQAEGVEGGGPLPSPPLRGEGGTEGRGLLVLAGVLALLWFVD